MPRDHRPNGAGKSTLLNCLIGKLIPDTGSVMFDGQSVLGRTPYKLTNLVFRVFQTPEIFGDLTVFENMMIPIFAKRDGAFALDAISDFMSHKDVVEQAENELEEMNMADKRHMHTASYRGDKRRLEIGMCLSQQPRLLLLDEPTAGMARADTNNTIDLLKEIKKSATSQSQSSNTICMLCSLWQIASPFWPKGHLWSRMCLRKSKATQR